MAMARRPKITEETISVPKLVDEVATLRDYFDKMVPAEHGNVSLREEDVLILMLCSFFEPTVRSLRTIEQLAQVPSIKNHLNVDQVPRSTLSDAISRFRVEHLRPLIQQLQNQVPHLERRDPELKKLADKILAGDGTMLKLAGEVAWAMQRRKNDKKQIDSQVKAHVLVDVEHWTVENVVVTGGDHEGGEPAAMKAMLRPGAVYLFDRAYYPFDFINAVLAADADMVVRLKSDIVFRATERRSLSATDAEAGVREDHVGYLGVKDGRKSPPPQQLMRLVCVWDEGNQVIVRLLTSLMDVEPWVIGHLYRLRWVIELFFRWLKVTVGFSHLLSANANGITLQLYTGMICTLLIHIRTGLPVDKYSLLALGLVASGRCDFEDQMKVIAKRQREKMLEKQRLARKKLKKPNAILPG